MEPPYDRQGFPIALYAGCEPVRPLERLSGSRPTTTHAHRRSGRRLPTHPGGPLDPAPGAGMVDCLHSVGKPPSLRQLRRDHSRLDRGPFGRLCGGLTRWQRSRRTSTAAMEHTAMGNRNRKVAAHQRVSWAGRLGLRSRRASWERTAVPTIKPSVTRRRSPEGRAGHCVCPAG